MTHQRSVANEAPQYHGLVGRQHLALETLTVNAWNLDHGSHESSSKSFGESNSIRHDSRPNQIPQRPRKADLTPAVCRSARNEPYHQHAAPLIYPGQEMRHG